jgi:nitrate reductase gamma subunit
MTLLDFARGPALQIAFTIFAFGMLWRLTSLLLLPWARERSAARPGAPSRIAAATRGFVRHMWPPRPIAGDSLFATLNSYVFHIGLLIIVMGLAQHVLFFQGLLGLTWPHLPSGVVSFIAVVTLASLVAALTRRLTSPVLKLISTADDYFTWLVTFLPVVTGLVAVGHLWARYETLLAIHMLSVALFLIWFPFGKLMHAALVFLTRSETAIFYSRRGVEI